REPSLSRRLTAYRLEGGDEPGAGAPRDVEARHAVAVAVGRAVTTLRPPDHGEEPDAALVQPGALLAGRPLDIRLRPAHRPAVLIRQPVEAGRPRPVAPGQVDAVVDPHPPLLGAVDQEEPTEGPPGLTAE